MKANKNEPFSNLRKRVVRVVEKGTPVTPITSIPEAMRTASPATSVEEITPHPKKQCHTPNPIPGFVTMTGMLISSLNLILIRTNLTF